MTQRKTRRPAREEAYDTPIGCGSFVNSTALGVGAATPFAVATAIMFPPAVPIFTCAVGATAMAHWWVKIRNEQLAGNIIKQGETLVVPEKKAVKTVQGEYAPALSRVTNYSDNRKVGFGNNDITPSIQHVQSVTALPEPSNVLPEKIELGQLLDSFKPSLQQILLALGPGGQMITVPVDKLWHVAIAGATGGGKSCILRLIIPQILAVGGRALLCDPHYAPFDPETGEDWRPIERRLYRPPATTANNISKILSWASNEIDRRLALRNAGQKWGAPYFIVMDEVPIIMKRVDDAPYYMARILQEGRKVGIFLITSAQDMLVKTLKFDSGAVRDCFRTAFYVGGDKTTGRLLLDVQGKLDDSFLGQGIVMLKSKAAPQYTLARVPLVSNESIERLLPPPTPERIVVNSYYNSQPETSKGNVRSNEYVEAEKVVTLAEEKPQPPKVRYLSPRDVPIEEIKEAAKHGITKIIDLAQHFGFTSPSSGTVLKRRLEEAS